jgi:hypothetical protein
LLTILSQLKQNKTRRADNAGQEKGKESHKEKEVTGLLLKSAPKYSGHFVFII